MKDFRETIRVLRLRLHGLEVLLAAEGGRRTEGWFFDQKGRRPRQRVPACRPPAIAVWVPEIVRGRFRKFC